MAKKATKKTSKIKKKVGAVKKAVKRAAKKVVKAAKRAVNGNTAHAKDKAKRKKAGLMSVSTFRKKFASNKTALANLSKALAKAEEKNSKSLKGGKKSLQLKVGKAAEGKVPAYTIVVADKPIRTAKQKATSKKTGAKNLVKAKTATSKKKASVTKKVKDAVKKTDKKAPAKKAGKASKKKALTPEEKEAFKAKMAAGRSKKGARAKKALENSKAKAAKTGESYSRRTILARQVREARKIVGRDAAKKALQSAKSA